MENKDNNKESKADYTCNLDGKITHKVINDTADSLEIGSVSKGGKIKCYGNFNKIEEFKAKIDKAKEVQEYAQAQICINI